MKLYFVIQKLFFTSALLLSIVSSAFAAGITNRPAAYVSAISGDSAQVNNERLAPGATLFPGERITLGADSYASVGFGGTTVQALPLTEFIVRSNGITFLRGAIETRTSASDSFNVEGAFFQVNAAAGSARIAFDGRNVQVTALTGSAILSGNGKWNPFSIPAGSAVMMNAAGQISESTAAGQISRLIPEVQIDRASTHVIAQVSTPVYWNDELRSGRNGRAHIALKDGSLLNLGSNSVLRIVQHDAQAQQTSLDLAAGRLRGRVVKLTRPGAKFEIRTPVGVAGIVGTDFSILVTNDFVEVTVFDGVVRFTTLLNAKAIDISAGQKIRVAKSGTVSGPQSVGTDQLQNVKNSTDISTVPGQPATAVAGNSPKLPIVASVFIAVPVVGASIYLVTHQTVSPSKP